jgi:hypothetical protein
VRFVARSLDYDQIEDGRLMRSGRRASANFSWSRNSRW